MSQVPYIDRDWISGYVAARDEFLRAKKLYDEENYGDAEVIVCGILARLWDATADQQSAVAGADVVALQCWCKFRSKDFDGLGQILDELGQDAVGAHPQLQVIWIRYLIQRGSFVEAIELCRSFLDAIDDQIPVLAAEFLIAQGVAELRIGRFDAALAALEQAYAIFALARNPRACAQTSNALGIALFGCGRLKDAMAWYKRAAGFFSTHGTLRERSMAALNVGICCYKIAEYEQAQAHLLESLRLGTKANAPHRQCFANIALGNVHRLTRDFESARRHLHTAYNQAQELQFPREEALALEFLGDVYRDEGQTEAARRFYARALAIALQIAPEGDIVMEVRRRNGECFGLEKRPAEAMPELQRALDMSRAQKDRFEEGVTLRVMAEVAYRSQDLASARRFVDKACEILVEIGARHEAAIALLHSVEVRLAEIESGRGPGPRGVLLEQAWRQATEALDLFMRVDVRWWTDRCRAAVARVSAMRSAAERGAVAGARAGAKESGYDPGDVFVHASTAMRDLVQLCDMFASCDDPVLITGETGTGKEVIARRLHSHSRRAEGPMVVVNVAAIPQTMFEREFFGHTKGAFSGADRDGCGFAAQANGGTLFLDEIGDLPLDVQPKLLRLLQESTYQAIGDPKARRTDVRLVAATNANLRQLVAEGRFRADLYYRLQTLELDIAPLRDRPEDVLPLLRHFLSVAANRPVDLAEYFNRRSLSQLVRHDWPGNAREIAIVARRAHLALTTQGRVQVVVTHADGSQLVADGPGDGASEEPAVPAGLSAAEAAERSRILMAIDENGGSRLLAARSLGMGRSTLYRKLARFGIATRRD